MSSAAIQSLLEVASVIGAGVLAYVAMQRDSRPLGLVATLYGATVLSGVLLFGFFIFPFLFLVWRKQPRKGFGWILLASMVLSTLVLAWRIPWPGPMPEGVQQSTTATVLGVDTVEYLWPVRGESSGEQLRLPFDVVTMELASAGTRAPLRIVDTVDHASVAGLRKAGPVRVSYSPYNPQSARIADASRSYARDAFIYFLELTYGIGLALVVVGAAVRWLWLLIFRPGTTASHLVQAQRELRDIASLPADDPRRKVLDEIARRATSRSRPRE